jgi:hypothetical protein
LGVNNVVHFSSNIAALTVDKTTIVTVCKWVSEIVFSAKWAICQLNDGENKLHVLHQLA